MDHSGDKWWRVLLSWAGAFFGNITLNSAVLWATLIFTIVHTVVLLRNNFFRKGKSDAETD